MYDQPPPPYESAFTSQPSKYGNPSRDDVIIHHPPPPPIQHPPIPRNELETGYVLLGNRLIFDFEKVTCLPGQASGLDEVVKFNVPTELLAIGVEPDLWQEWMKDLDEVQEMAPTICGCMIMFCCPGLMVQSCLCAAFCPISGDHPLKCLPCFYGDWYVGLTNWMTKVNLVLNRREMHAKLLTYKPFNNAPKSKNFGTRTTGKDHNYEMSFLAIAVTKEESLKLQQESWDHGVGDKCTSGIGRCL